jgi:hypothetical protein
LKERGIVLFPLFASDARAALNLLDADELKCRPLTPNAWRSHNWTINLPYGEWFVTGHRPLYDRLVWALDQVQYQTGGDFIETADGLRAVLLAGLESIDDSVDARCFIRGRSGCAR